MKTQRRLSVSVSLSHYVLIKIQESCFTIFIVKTCYDVQQICFLLYRRPNKLINLPLYRSQSRSIISINLLCMWEHQSTKTLACSGTNQDNGYLNGE